MNKLKAILITMGILVSPLIFAQEVEMADTMRSEGKIYVVVAILLTILAGILLYVFLTDRKISSLEKKIAEKKELNHAFRHVKANREYSLLR